MGSEWKEVSVQEIAERTASGPFGSNIRRADYVESGIPVIRGINLAGPRFLDDGYVYVTPEKAEQLSASATFPEDIVFAARGSIGRVGIVPERTFFRYILSSNLIKLTVDRSLADSLYVFYYFRSWRGQHEIHSYVSTTGVPKIARALESLRKFRVLLPPLPEQHAIAHILSTLDDKIELNWRMNETLEAMARAIFKSWFMDFDPVYAKAEGCDPGLPKPIADLFPDRFEDSELGKIPAEWAVKKIEEIAERVGMGPFGSSIKVETFVPDGIPIISGQHLNSFMMEDTTFNFISPDHAEKLKNSNVERGDVIFTHAGNIGQVAFIPEKSRYDRYVISQRQFFMRCDRAHVAPIFIAFYFKSPEGQHKLLANSSSSGVPSIARPVTYLRSIQLSLPPKLIMDEFHKLVSPMLLQFHNNLEEAYVLASQRDTLLPKLISGELRVKDAERFIGRAV